MTSERTVTVVGGGVAGMSAACALAELGWRVRLLERRNYLGGRASSFLHPGVGETIDNCQHVLFGCCTNLVGFYRRIGAGNRVHWTSEMTMIEPGGRRTTLAPSSWLPAPMHALPRFLAAGAFSAADKYALCRAFAAFLRPQSNADERLSAWLARHGQTRGAIERFWRLVIASALNADLDQIAVPYAAKVIRELFLNSAEAGRMGVSSVPLGELYAGAADFLTARKGEISFNTAVEAAEWSESTRTWKVRARRGAEELAWGTEYLVLAVPFEAMGRLLPGLPPAPGRERLAEQVGQHEHWPICSVHVWLDRPVTELDHAVLLDREIHWMFNKGKFQPQRGNSGSYLELVVSASREFAALSREEAVTKAMAELKEFFPAAASARLVKSAFVKEVHATFGVSPGIDAARPSAVSPWANCALAGDWTATGWPSTMESAARSGHLAAEKIVEWSGTPARFLEADLKPTGLMRFFG